MSPSNHALLSASSSHRWLNCPRSVRASEGIESETTEFAIEGSCAHELAENMLKKALGQEYTDCTENLTYYNTEMQESADGYVAFVLEKMAEMPSPSVFIEQRLDLTAYITEGFGTGDCVLVGDGVLHIIDFKYGAGVAVDARNNEQLRIYALGAYDIFKDIYDITTVRMSIYQPRKAYAGTDEMQIDALLSWAQTILKPKAELAFNGEGDFCAGDWCRFCPIRNSCRERAEKNLELAKYDFAKPPELTDSEVAELLPKLDSFIEWAEGLKEYALKQALDGKHFDGFKLVEGRSLRKFNDEAAVASVLRDAGYEPYTQKLQTLTELTKLLGKVKFEELLGKYIVKPAGKPTLVPESDKRPAIKK